MKYLLVAIYVDPMYRNTKNDVQITRGKTALNSTVIRREQYTSKQPGTQKESEKHKGLHEGNVNQPSNLNFEDEAA